MIEHYCADHGLFIMGQTAEVTLIGAGPDMWAHFSASPEYQSDAPDPLDRWSKRIIDALAQMSGVEAVYPSDGPPYPPVISWALETGRFWQSPTGMMVHDLTGLWISIRGVLITPGQQATKTSSPCLDCDALCATACPVSALSADASYDVPRCKAHLATDEGQSTCMTQGCMARLACPVSQNFNRPAPQSAFHMRAFVGS